MLNSISQQVNTPLDTTWIYTFETLALILPFLASYPKFKERNPYLLGDDQTKAKGIVAEA